MSNPLVSIIMPAYNSELYISESIESVIDQTHTNWELLIIDDGSIDNTSEIINQYQKKDDRIYYYYQKNARQAKARNLGIKNSKGDFIAFLDSDDLWLPQKLELSLNEFLSGDQDLLFTSAYLFENSSQLSDIKSLSDIKILAKTFYGNDGLSQFLYENRVPMLTVLCKKEAISIGFNEANEKGIAEDYELWLNLLANGYTLRGVDLKLSLYRVHENSTTATNNMDINVIKMFTRFFSEYPQLKAQSKNQILHWLFKILNQATNKDDIYQIYNRKILSKLSVNINCISLLYYIRNLLPLAISKKILGRLLRNYDN